MELALPGRPGRNLTTSRSDEFQRALERAMKLLAIRARSRRELSERLLAMGFGRTAVESVDLRLAELGLVDDSEFALQRVRHLLSKGRSAGATKMDLVAHGLPEELIDGSLDEIAGASTDLDRAIALARRRALAAGHLPGEKALQRVARYLSAKGYEPEVVEEACREAFGERAPDAND